MHRLLGPPRRPRPSGRFNRSYASYVTWCCGSKWMQKLLVRAAEPRRYTCDRAISPHTYHLTNLSDAVSSTSHTPRDERKHPITYSRNSRSKEAHPLRTTQSILPSTMAQSVGSYTNPLKKFKLVFLGEQSGNATQSHPLPYQIHTIVNTYIFHLSVYADIVAQSAKPPSSRASCTTPSTAPTKPPSASTSSPKPCTSKTVPCASNSGTPPAKSAFARSSPATSATHLSPSSSTTSRRRKASRKHASGSTM